MEIEMHQRPLLIVGDKFQLFATAPDVLTLSQLRGLLSLPQEFAALHAEMILVPGQGLRDQDMVEVLDWARQSPIGRLINISLWPCELQRAPKALSHKHNPDNTLISLPRRLDEENFELELIVPETCELMSDHQTGRHVQGMLFVEAGRQAGIAIIEAYLLPVEFNNAYFILSDISIDYRKFAFPFEVNLRCRLLEQAISAASRRYRLELTVTQSDEEVAVLLVTLTAVNRRSIERKEAAMGSEALGKYFSEVNRKLAELREKQLAS